ncbi:MAG TPA: ATP-binding protein [Dehalococcoidia bacterium]|nr:ATP-binding protein [Dehalococcoidia bacterium]
MPDSDPALLDLILHAREERNIEYKGSSGQEPFAWGVDAVNSRIARTTMAMANIGGGSIVIGMDQVAPDAWEPNGVSDEVDASYQQDRVQEYVNGRADPFVELAVRHVGWEERRFVIVQVNGFRELPLVCTRNGMHLREAAIYTRTYARHESAEIRTQSEMRELLDRAIAVGVEQRLQPIIAALRGLISPQTQPSDAKRFEQQRGNL